MLEVIFLCAIIFSTLKIIRCMPINGIHIVILLFCFPRQSLNHKIFRMFFYSELANSKEEEVANSHELIRQFSVVACRLFTEPTSTFSRIGKSGEPMTSEFWTATAEQRVYTMQITELCAVPRKRQGSLYRIYSVREAFLFLNELGKLFLN